MQLSVRMYECTVVDTSRSAARRPGSSRPTRTDSLWCWCSTTSAGREATSASSSSGSPSRPPCSSSSSRPSAQLSSGSARLCWAGVLRAQRLDDPDRDRRGGPEVPAVRHRPAHQPHARLWSAHRPAGRDLRRRRAAAGAAVWRDSARSRRAGQWPPRPWRSPRFSSQPAAASNRRWTGASTGAATTTPGPLTPSARGYASRSTWTPSQPSCSGSWTRRCSRPGYRCGCGPPSVCPRTRAGGPRPVQRGGRALAACSAWVRVAPARRLLGLQRLRPDVRRDGAVLALRRQSGGRRSGRRVG
jgi:hypothetical protein